MTDTAQQVQVLLDLAGISPSPSELEQLEAVLPDMRTRIDALWALDVGDVPPSLVFRAAEPTGPSGGDGA